VIQKSLTQKVEVSFGEGKFKVEGTAITTSNGVIVLILGGEEPHIGSVAIALPRPSLRNQTKITTLSPP